MQAFNTFIHYKKSKLLFYIVDLCPLKNSLELNIFDLNLHIYTSVYCILHVYEIGISSIDYECQICSIKI